MKPTVSVMMISRSDGKAQPPRGRIERGEQLVLDQHVAVGERVEQRRLAGVGVADDRHHRQLGLGAQRAPLLAPLAELLDLLLEQVDLLARAAAVDLELGLAGAAPADAAGEARHHRVLLVQPRQRVLELRQLDLQLAVARLRVLREDVEDQHGAIDDLELGGVGDGARLRRREIVIEHQHGGVGLQRARHQLVELALADEEARIDLLPALRHHVEHAHAGGAAQLLQLGEARLRDRSARGCSTCTSTARSCPSSTPRAPTAAGANSSSSDSISSRKSRPPVRCSSCTLMVSSVRHCSFLRVGRQQVRAVIGPSVPSGFIKIAATRSSRSLARSR